MILPDLFSHLPPYFHSCKDKGLSLLSLSVLLATKEPITRATFTDTFCTYYGPSAGCSFESGDFLCPPVADFGPVRIASSASACGAGLPQHLGSPLGGFVANGRNCTVHGKGILTAPLRYRLAGIWCVDAGMERIARSMPWHIPNCKTLHTHGLPTHVEC